MAITAQLDEWGRPAWIALMVLSFIVFWPLGLAILPLYMKIWNRDGREKTIEFLSRGFDVFLVAAGLMMALAAAGSVAVSTMIDPRSPWIRITLLAE